MCLYVDIETKIRRVLLTNIERVIKVENFYTYVTTHIFIPVYIGRLILYRDQIGQY